MTDHDDQNLKAFLKLHEPTPPPQTPFEAEQAYRAIEASMAQESDSRAHTRPRPFVSRSTSWAAGASFIAATVVGILMTTKTLNHPQAQPATQMQVAATVSDDADALDANDDEGLPTLEVGEDWLELVAAY